MLSEAIHSLVDTANQGLLLIGITRAKRYLMTGDWIEVERAVGDKLRATAQTKGVELSSADVERATKIARDLYTGGCFINGVTASDPRVPVGGVKNSGYGRELSHFGVHAFVNAQTVWIENP